LDLIRDRVVIAHNDSVKMATSGRIYTHACHRPARRHGGQHFNGKGEKNLGNQ
jgi:hypothetical protein